MSPFRKEAQWLCTMSRQNLESRWQLEARDILEARHLLQHFLRGSTLELARPDSLHAMTAPGCVFANHRERGQPWA